MKRDLRRGMSDPVNPADREMLAEQIFELKQNVEQKGKNIRFPMYVTKRMLETDIAELELSVRSGNCLRRAGYHTVGQLVEGICGSEDLKRIRNCGTKSVKEIMNRLLWYQFEQLPPERRKAYLKRLLELNG